MEEVSSILEQIIALLEGTEGAFASIGAVIAGIFMILELIVSVVVAAFGAISLVGSFVVAVVGIIVSAVVFVAVYLLNAIPLYNVAKHAGYKYAWLVWIPVFQFPICIFVLSRVSGKEEFEFWNGKIKIKQGLVVFMCYVLLYFMGDAIITTILLVLCAVPGVGYIFSGTVGLLMYYIPEVIMGIVEYVYLRDTLDVFKADKKKNQVHAFVVTVLDCFVTFGWARVIYLVTVMRMKPIPIPKTEETEQSQSLQPVIEEQGQ